ncbi:MAG: biopolymer transporter ExbD [Limnohabitans sp.]|nr:biopolymer transporter ExbD [Limnohabitans sp.]
MAFGEFEKRQSHAPMGEINVTPLVDVMLVLVLVVIFIIAAPLMTSALHMELPQADVPPDAARPVLFEVVLDSTGQLTVDGQPLSTGQLAAALSLRAAAAQTTEVQLKVDKSVPYGKVAEVLAEIQKSDLHSVSLAVQSAAPKIQPTSPPPRN